MPSDRRVFLARFDAALPQLQLAGLDEHRLGTMVHDMIDQVAAWRLWWAATSLDRAIEAKMQAMFDTARRST